MIDREKIKTEIMLEEKENKGRFQKNKQFT